MSSKKRIAAVAITIAALSVGSVVGASAHDNGAGRGVAKTAEQIAKHEDRDVNRAAREALITSTIGLDAATIKTRLQAGESLGAIAGTKKAALITALVAAHTTKIDADVAAGKLTAAQATTRKAGLIAHVTERVDAAGGKGMGRGHDGKGDKGMGHKGSRH